MFWHCLYLELLLTPPTLQITFKSIVTISVPVTHLPFEEAHKEFNSLEDKIATKYEQLDSGQFGAVGTPASLFAHMSQLCQRLNLPILQALKSTFQVKITGRQSWLGYGGCSFVPIHM